MHSNTEVREAGGWLLTPVSGVVGREDPDAELKEKHKVYSRKHKARTKNAAEPDMKNLNCDK